MSFRIKNSGGTMAITLILVLGFVISARAEGEGEKVYKAKCVACHGADGSAQTKAGQSLHARDFHSPELGQESDATLASVIAKGKNKMPKFGERLTDEEIKSVVAYVRTLAKSH